MTITATAGGSRVRLLDGGVPDAEADSTAAGWAGLLGKLRVLAETGRWTGRAAAARARGLIRGGPPGSAPRRQSSTTLTSWKTAPDRPEDQARRHRSRRSAAPFRHPAAQRRGAPDRPDLHPSRGPCQVPFGRALGGSARGYLAVDGAPQQSRYGLLDGRLFCISIHRHPWGECPHLPRRSSAAGHGKDLGHATRSVGYRELRQPRTRADGESPSRRATLAFACPARIPAATRDLQFVELDRKGPAEQVNMACCARRCRLPTRRQGPRSGRRSLQRSGPVGAVDDHLAIGRHRRSSRP